MRTDSMPIVRLQTGRLQQHDWHPLHRVLAATCIVFLLSDSGGLSPKDTCHGMTRPTMRSATKAVCSCPQPPDAAPDSDIGMFEQNSGFCAMSASDPRQRRFISFCHAAREARQAAARVFSVHVQRGGQHYLASWQGQYLDARS